jgi:hypothetical protein
MSRTENNGASCSCWLWTLASELKSIDDGLATYLAASPALFVRFAYLRATPRHDELSQEPCFMSPASMPLQHASTSKSLGLSGFLTFLAWVSVLHFTCTNTLACSMGRRESQGPGTMVRFRVLLYIDHSLRTVHFLGPHTSLGHQRRVIGL